MSVTITNRKALVLAKMAQMVSHGIEYKVETLVHEIAGEKCNSLGWTKEEIIAEINDVDKWWRGVLGRYQREVQA